MQITFLTTDYPTDASHSGSGVGTFTFKMAHALVHAGVGVSVVSWPNGNQDRNFDDNGVPVSYTERHGNLHYYVSRLPAIGRSSSLIYLLKQYELNQVAKRQLRSVCRERVPCALVETPSIGELSWRWKRILQFRPYVVMIHGSYFLFKKELGQGFSLPDYIREAAEIRFMQRATAVIAPSEFVASHYREKLGDKLHCIPYPISLEMSPRDLRRTPNGDQITVLAMSALSRSKGLDTLLKAIPHVVHRDRRIRFMIAGHDADFTAKTILSHAEREGVANAVSVVGYVPWSKVGSYFHECDVFVSASRCETFGQTIAEAMLAGKPVVATRAGAIPEVVEDGITGLLVGRDDAEALASAILRLGADATLRERMGGAGRARALRLYDMTVVLKKRLEVYRAAIDGMRPRSFQVS